MTFQAFLHRASHQEELAGDLGPAADASALFMLALLFFLLSCFAIAALRLRRRSKLPPSPEQQLLEEVKVDEDSWADKPLAPPKESWEKDADWWR